MTPRHFLLVGAAALILGVGVYLFVEVRSQPAEAHVENPRRPAKSPSKAPVLSDATASSDTAPRKPAPNPSIGRVRTGSDDTQPPARPTMPLGSHPSPEAAPPDDGRPNPKLEAVMAEANKAYDRGDLDEATAIAQKVLAVQPGNVRMLRVLTSVACIQGDIGEARKHYAALPAPDREQMRTRCDRYGVTFNEVTAPRL